MRWLLLLPIVALLILFALSNTAPVRVGLWPTDLSITVPLSIAVLIAMAGAFLLGGLCVWFSGLRYRRRARQAEAQLRALRAQVAELRGRLPVSTQLLPPPEVRQGRKERPGALPLDPAGAVRPQTP